MPPVTANDLATQNRRIGDFLKELQLTESRGTGFPNIYKLMAKNGSPSPIFETDEQHYVMVTISAHPNFTIPSECRRKITCFSIL
jgi:ATP-dependent DNA helicase RecG